MALKRHVPMLIQVVAVCAGAACPLALLAEDPVRLDELRKRWRAEARAVKTAEITLDFFQFHPREPISRQRAEQFVRDCRQAWSKTGETAPLQKATRTLGLPPAAFAQAWKSGRIRWEGTKVRNHFRSNLVSQSIAQEIDASFDGKIDVQFVKESKQVWITEQGPAFKRFGLRDLWCLGPLEEDARVVGRVGNRLTVDAPPVRYEIDTDAGSVLDVDMRAGKMARHVAQFGFGQYDVGGGQIVFPSVCVSFSELDDRVASLSLFVIKTARFNGPLGADAFAVPIPEGINAVYYSSPAKVLFRSIDQARQEPPPSVVTRQAYADARQLVELLRARAAPPARPTVIAPEKPRPWAILMAVNVAVAIVLLFWLLVRRPR